VTYVIAKVSIHYKDRRASAAVIPAQAGIRFIELQLFRINFETLIASFPTKVGIQNVKSEETVLSDKFPHRQT
ncbi:hypothetical protein, partial [Neisseria meningitidis]|uniref:hypothetical protein n=1 Tax=Neisseria meningitidis TaxID=487 RepID=UPI001BA95A86